MSKQYEFTSDREFNRNMNALCQFVGIDTNAAPFAAPSRKPVAKGYSPKVGDRVLVQHYSGEMVEATVTEVDSRRKELMAVSDDGRQFGEFFRDVTPVVA